MRWLKIAAGILGVLALIIILSAILLITFVSPNRFKPLITEQVKKYTGRDLIIDGDLSWTIFPYLGVKAGHLELTNPVEFKQRIFAEIQSVTVGLKIMPLFSAKLESSGISFKGMKLYLIKNENGKTNWEDLQSASEAGKKESPTTDSNSSIKRMPMSVALAGVDVTNAMISWANEQTKQYFDIDKFNLHAKDISLTRPFLLTVNFNFSGKNPEMDGKVSLTGKMSLNADAQNYMLREVNLLVDANQDSKKVALQVKGDAAIDMLNRTMILDNFIGQIANLKVTGKMQVSELGSAAKAVGHLQILPFDMKQWLQSTGRDTKALQVIKNVSGNIDFTSSTSMNSLDVDGNIKIDELQASNIQIKHIDIKTKYNKGILDLAPFSAAFYQGSLDGKAKVNLNAAEPQIAVQAKLANVQAEPLLKDLSPNNKLKLTGTTNIDLLLSTVGVSGDSVVKNLNGVIQLSFNNGVLQGVDIGYLLESANALANKQSLPKTNANQTQFDSLTAKAIITSGLVANEDLYLNSPRFEVRGKGRINLVKHTINYDLQAAAKSVAAGSIENKATTNIGVSIPISIAGSLDDPSIRMNVDALMKTIAQQQLQKSKTQVQKLQEKYKDKIPEGAGAFINKFLGH